MILVNLLGSLRKLATQSGQHSSVNLMTFCGVICIFTCVYINQDAKPVHTIVVDGSSHCLKQCAYINILHIYSYIAHCTLFKHTIQFNYHKQYEKQKLRSVTLTFSLTKLYLFIIKSVSPVHCIYSEQQQVCMYSVLEISHLLIK